MAQRVTASVKDSLPIKPPKVYAAGDATRTATPTSAPDLQPVAPTHLRPPERYEVLGEHGRGGIGCVSRAHDRELGRVVAIKELISRGHLSEARFLREALVTARLEHPGIVPVYEAGRWPDGTPYYAMKLVAGRPLRELISERTTVDQRIGLLHHVIAVADAIAYAHGRNIIHRDLKPANVIVGDFGETIVIDWGLAKDVSAEDEPLIDGIQIRSTDDRDLTVAGTVLGTPTYMAPEQERGEHVDQRADVYAIGAMLWELCSLHKAPPTSPHQRHRVLRRSGIDKDLIVILDKALDPDPMRRYPDAGALAADLKAFKSGARISARSYSLLGMFAHWMRRNRGLSVVLATVIAVTTTGTALYIRNIAAERDRADRSENSARTSLDELTLKHAELLLTTDPSAALDSIGSYQGVNINRARQIRAEALGRGVAVMRATPHTDSIHWATGVPGGDVISLSIDGTISRTSPDGRSRLITTGVKKAGVYAYAPSRHLLAYICDPGDLCILETTTDKQIHVPPRPGYSPRALSFSPDERQLALLSDTGELRILDVAFPEPPSERFQMSSVPGSGVLFVERDTVAVGTLDGLRLVHVNGTVQSLVDPDGGLWDIGPTEHQLAVGTYTGKIYLLDTRTLDVSAHVQPCHSLVSGLKSLPTQRVVAFACKEGLIGIWDPKDGSIIPKAHIDGHANMLAVSDSGDYLVAAGDKGTLILIDLQTAISSSLEGQGFRITKISAPTSEYPFILSVDVRGGVRAWRPPDRFASVLADIRARAYSMIHDEATNTIIMGTRTSVLTTYSPKVGVKTVQAHTRDTPFIKSSASRQMFATYGSSASVEIWTVSPLQRTRVLDTRHGTVSHVEFVGTTEDIITSGTDGRLVHWSSNGESHEIHDFRQAIETFALIADNDSIVLATQDGALWLIGKDLRVAALRPPGTRVTRMLSLPDNISVCVGYADGVTAIWDMRSQREIRGMSASAAIRDIAVTADGQMVALAANDNTILLGTQHDGVWASATWMALSARVRQVALTRDGLLISICTDGTVWIYSSRRQKWSCVVTGTEELTQIVLDDAGARAFVLDVDGHLISLDLISVQRSLDV
jgi:serine/threonine protein kinase/WD40 repeat protein